MHKGPTLVSSCLCKLRHAVVHLPQSAPFPTALSSCTLLARPRSLLQHLVYRRILSFLLSQTFTPSAGSPLVCEKSESTCTEGFRRGLRAAPPEEAGSAAPQTQFPPQQEKSSGCRAWHLWCRNSFSPGHLSGLPSLLWHGRTGEEGSRGFLWLCLA